MTTFHQLTEERAAAETISIAGIQLDKVASIATAKPKAARRRLIKASKRYRHVFGDEGELCLGFVEVATPLLIERAQRR